MSQKSSVMQLPQFVPKALTSDTGMNPDFFKGTVVEDAVEKLMAEAPAIAAE